MTRSRIFAAVIVAVLAAAVGACGNNDEAGQEPTAAATLEPTPAPTPCALREGSMEPKTNMGSESALVTDVRPNAQGCPRVVFEFQDQESGYDVRYVDPPFTECGSGATIPTSSWEAGAYLHVRLEPAASADLSKEDAPPTYKGPRDIAVRGAVLKHLKVDCDFEGVFSWIVGLDERRNFNVFTLDSPSRIVIDISQV
jgi:hypothetical protein